MAFAQPQRRPRHRTRHTNTVSENDPLAAPPSTVHSSNSSVAVPITEVITHSSAPAFTASTVSTSNTETDWHVIGSVLRSPSSANFSTFNTPPQPSRNTHHMNERHGSPLSMESSEPESFSSFRPSDTESFSDIDFAFDALPSHDGTGTFMDAELDQTSEEEGIQQQLSPQIAISHQPQSQSMAISYRPNYRNGLSSSFRDFEPNSPSMPNILLPYGGIHLPSFATNSNQGNQDHSTSTTDTLYYSTSTTSPTFQPTVIAEDIVLSSDKTTQSRRGGIEDSNKSSDDQTVFTRKKKRTRNLDRIPTHHPSIPGSITSLAILSAIWSNLQRLTNHLIENDTYTADTFTSLVSEANLEGCLPFGSHLHMELATGLRQDYPSQ